MTKPKQRNRGLILRQSDDGWEMSAATLQSSGWHGLSSERPEAFAKQAAEFVATHGLEKNVAIALDSKSTFAASFAVRNVAETRDRRVMSYKVEELLPVAAEDFAADYIHDGTNVLGIATQHHVLLPLVTALEEQGLSVHSISPSVISAMQAFVGESGNSSSTSDSDFVVWQDEDALELMRVGRRVSDWYHLQAEPTQLVQKVGAVLLRNQSPVRVKLIDVDAKISEALEGMPGVELEHVKSESLREHARRGAVAALNGTSRPWCELRRDKLVVGDPFQAVRSDWQWCQWALALLLMCCAFFFWMRGRQYDQLAGGVRESQRTVYQSVFPNSKIPNAVVSRLKSERAKLSGARGKEAAVEQPLSALNVLYDLLAGMPESMRLQVQQLRVEDGKVFLDANVRSVGNAGELADALEKHGFSIEPPATEQYEADRVSVRINGRVGLAGSDDGQ